MRKKIELFKITLVFAAVWVIFNPVLCLAGGNLLCDAGFDESEPNGGFSESGCWFQNIGDSGIGGYAPFAARSGINGLFLYTGFATDQGQTKLYQELPCAAGRRYFASAWVKPGWDGFLWLTGSRSYVKVEFLDCDRTILAQYASKAVETIDSGWMLLYFATYPAPVRTCFVRFSLILEKPDLVGLTFASFDDCILREIECTDCIRFNEVPSCGNDDLLKGSVIGINPADYKIGIYIFVDDWWPKPMFAVPWTDINPDGSWQCDISWAESDLRATEIMAFLVPVNEIANWPVDFSNPVGLSALPGEAFRFPSAGSFRPSCFDSIPFAGFNWLIKDSGTRPVDPGGNIFNHNNVWVDDDGMHLKVTKVGDSWHCAEVFMEKSLGGGTYRFVVDNNTPLLDPTIVLGLFTWDKFAPHYTNREMDIEISRWNNPFADNAQYVIQPADAGRIHRFNVDPCDKDITHILEWGFGVAGFESFYGTTLPPDETTLIDSWVYAGNDVPRPGNENVRINLWLNGEAPTDGNEVEVIIKDFEVTPCFYEVSPAVLDFDSVLVSKPKTKPVTIANSNHCIPYIVVVGITGPDANNFHVADRAFSLEPGSSKNIDVTFIPDTNRVFEAALEITSAIGAVSVPLKGRGSRITYTRIPAMGSPGFLEGLVSGVNLPDYRVVSYIFVFDTWYIKPLCVSGSRSINPLVQISSDGLWRCNIDLEWTDKAATDVASFLIPKNAVYPPCVLSSLDDSRMSQYDRVSVKRPKLSISGIRAKASNSAGDEIVIDGWYFIAMNEVFSAQRLLMTIQQADKVIWTQAFDFNPGKFMSQDGFNCTKNGASVKFDNQWMLLNSYAGKFRLSLKNAELTCLCSPITLSVGLGGFDESAIADEELDPYIINAKQVIPINFLAGCTDALRIDKLTFKRDSISIKGAMVFKGDPPDLTIEDVGIGWDSDTFNVPAGSFVRTSRSRPKYRCKKVVTPKGVVDAFFDFRADLFSIKISKAKLDAPSQIVAFNITMAGFSEGVSVKTGN
ncbi:MAG: hypothetical protein JW749_03900 [Sedimentisphaerales bacterium]|nr:hypothetical protein [Sedimentisphaerales bacterium]